jgi:hypothetical protein
LDGAILIDHKQGWHASQLQKFYFLLIDIGNAMPGVGQTNEGKFFSFPIAFISVRTIWANGKDFRVTRGKSRILVAQASEMCAAIRSQKTAQEGKNDMLFASEI